jgi:hypothetical protein
MASWHRNNRRQLVFGAIEQDVTDMARFVREKPLVDWVSVHQGEPELTAT